MNKCPIRRLVLVLADEITLLLQLVNKGFVVPFFENRIVGQPVIKYDFTSVRGIIERHETTSIAVFIENIRENIR
ncbi:hypothetical protein D3C86_2000980 [compost metagenome]